LAELKFLEVKGWYIINYFIKESFLRFALLHVSVTIFSFCHTSSAFNRSCTVFQLPFIDATNSLISPGFINLHCIANIDIQPIFLDTNNQIDRSKEWFNSRN
jgi:hypothetical protein